MTVFDTLVAAAAAIILFLFGLQGFSREIQEVGGDRLRGWLGRVTGNRWLAFAMGALATAIVQSSSATSALAVTLVDAAVLSFRSSLGVLLGANVGTTITVWLVSLKLTGIGSFLIVAAAVVSVLPGRLRILGKALFFFGVIFFALDLVSAGLKPLGNYPPVRDFLALATVPVVGVLAGALITAVIQSSSVTTGLVVILVQGGGLPVEAAIPIVVGANVGSTSTALVASLGLGTAARASAVANFIFNAAGMLLVLPVLGPLSNAFAAGAASPAMAVALAHLGFNLFIALLFLLLLDVIEPPLQRWLVPAPR